MSGALNSKEASGETIPAGLLDDLQEVSGLLEFTQEMMSEYRSLALESASDPEKLQNADARVLRKLKEIEGVLERKG